MDAYIADDHPQLPIAGAPVSVSDALKRDRYSPQGGPRVVLHIFFAALAVWALLATIAALPFVIG